VRDATFRGAGWREKKEVSGCEGSKAVLARPSKLTVLVCPVRSCQEIHTYPLKGSLNWCLGKERICDVTKCGVFFSVTCLNVIQRWCLKRRVATYCSTAGWTCTVLWIQRTDLKNRYLWALCTSGEGSLFVSVPQVGTETTAETIGC
jgi:hypothetical protein